MAQHEPKKREGQEEIEEEQHYRKKTKHLLYDQLKAPDEGVIGSLVEPSLEKHATLLANAHSDTQRSNIVIQLQQSYGNAYVQRLLNSRAVQAKLTVNAPDDAYEREADRVASQVQRQIEPEEEEELAQAKAISEVQRQAEPEEDEEEEEPAQAKAISEVQRQTVSEDLESRINMARGSGQPLPDSVRTSLEPKLGHDFSQVRLHTDAEANELSQRLGAEAFTTGKDIFFREGAYQPDTGRGKGLIAHELTHVVQQSEEAPALQRQATAQAEAPAAEAGVDKARLAALKAMFEVAVVGPLQKAYEVLGGDKPDAQAGFNHVQTSYEVLKSMIPSYKGVEPMYSRLFVLGNMLNVWGAQLRPHIGAGAIPLSQIREDINPDKNTTLDAIRSAF